MNNNVYEYLNQSPANAQGGDDERLLQQPCHLLQIPAARLVDYLPVQVVDGLRLSDRPWLYMAIYTISNRSATRDLWLWRNGD